MTEAEAMSCVGTLAANTNGWNDDTIGLYVEEFKMLSDPDVLRHTIGTVLRTWETTHRPPLAKVLEVYRSELRTKVDTRPALPPARGVVLSLDEARPLIVAAYEQEARRLGKRPNYEFLERFLGLGRQERQDSVRERWRRTR